MSARTGLQAVRLFVNLPTFATTSSADSLALPGDLVPPPPPLPGLTPARARRGSAERASFAVAAFWYAFAWMLRGAALPHEWQASLELQFSAYPHGHPQWVGLWAR